MKQNDLLRICLQNLMRRKSRTFLTVLGVLIGCCSIVIMVSLGIGMKQSQEKLLAEMGDLTIVTVNAPQGGRGKLKLDEALVRRLGPSPVWSPSPQAVSGGGVHPGCDRAPAAAMWPTGRRWWDWTPPRWRRWAIRSSPATGRRRAATCWWDSIWRTASGTPCALTAATWWTAGAACLDEDGGDMIRRLLF